MKKINQKKNNGFTMMETLVAIFILLLAITGPMVFAQNGLRSSFLARDQITAFFLAQDAIEYVKNIRDANVVNIVKSPDLSYRNWLDGLEECLASNGGCTIDTSSNVVIPDANDIKSCSATGGVGGSPNNPGCINEQSSDKNDYVPLNYENGVYTIEGSQESIFAREISIQKFTHNDDIGADNADIEAEIKVTVRWKSHEGVGVREIVVRENIFNAADALIN